MKIEIQNLGPVKNAKLDLGKKLTVFCGPNNSGKTYVAFMIYALTKSGSKFFRSDEGDTLIRELVKKEQYEYKLDFEKIWNYRIRELVDIRHSLGSIYGISEEVAEHLFSDFKISILQTKAEFVEELTATSFTHTFSIKTTQIEISKQANEKALQLSFRGKISEDIDIIGLFLISKIFSLVAFHPFIASHILPVERNSIYTFSKELSIQKQEFLEQAQELGSKKTKNPMHWYLRRSTRYPMAIRDGLEVAEDLTNLSKTKSDSYQIGLEIEQELLCGEVVLTREGEVQFKSNKAKSKRVPIHLTASIVKTLSSLVFYLKYIADKGELIIIDEPELNLHPNNQVTLTRVFAKLLNKGFRLLISTHSDYIIRELNNLIMSSYSAFEIKQVADKYGYTEDEQLDSADVNAYMFKYKNQGSKKVTVEPIAVDKFGFEVATIDETVDRLNMVAEELYFSIKSE